MYHLMGHGVDHVLHGGELPGKSHAKSPAVAPAIGSVSHFDLTPKIRVAAELDAGATECAREHRSVDAVIDTLQLGMPRPYRSPRTQTFGLLNQFVQLNPLGHAAILP
jgi:hypothetical protein